MNLTSKRVKRTRCLPAGRYYVGDLCYVLGHSEDWDPMIEKMYPVKNGPMKEGFHEMPNGMQFYAFSVDRDGVFYDEERRPYSVDAGLIGCVHEKHMSEESKKDIRDSSSNQDEAWGHMFDFEEPFECRVGGDSIYGYYIHIGDEISIALKEDDEAEEDEESEGEEISDEEEEENDLETDAEN